MLVVSHLATRVPSEGMRGARSSLEHHHILKLGGRQRAALAGPGADARPRLLVLTAALTAGRRLEVRETGEIGQTST